MLATADYVEELAADLRARAFAPLAGGRQRIGAEVEWIPVERASRRIAPIAGSGPTSSLLLLRELATANGWSERRSAKGVPVFALRDGGTITFEPGGQIELGAAPHLTATALIDQLQSIAGLLGAAAARRDVELLSTGIDPVNPIECVPLQLHAERYMRMAAHFGAIGPAGGRMMRQTASIQISVDPPLGDAGAATWRLANALAPYLLAIFANSSRYAGRPSGYRSFRGACWQALDPTRTGLAYGAGDPAERYRDFALDARAILVGPDARVAPTYREWVEHNGGIVDAEEWDAHLSTLFPEVRPRGYFEMRSIDALPPEWYPAPMALLSGILFDPASRRAASEVAGEPSAALLQRAARSGLGDALLARPAAELFEIGLTGCRRLGTAFLAERHLDIARGYYDQYTRRGRSPADDQP